MSKKNMQLLNKPSEIFLCPRCLQVMCEDCISTADEYQYRDRSLKVAAFMAEEKLKEAQQEIARLSRELQSWKSFVAAAYPDVIARWIASETKKNHAI